jgi:hypothetical protein
MIDMVGIDFPLEHADEMGPTTHREKMAKQTEDREDIF